MKRWLRSVGVALALIVLPGLTTAQVMPAATETPAAPTGTEPVVVGGVTYYVHPDCHIESIVLAKTQTYTGGSADLLTFIHIQGLGWTTVFQPGEPLTGGLEQKNVSDHLCGGDLPANLGS